MATMTPMAPMVPLDYYQLSPSYGDVAVRITITANGDQWCYYRHWCHWCQWRPMVPSSPLEPFVPMEIHWRSRQWWYSKSKNDNGINGTISFNGGNGDNSSQWRPMVLLSPLAPLVPMATNGSIIAIETIGANGGTPSPIVTMASMIPLASMVAMATMVSMATMMIQWRSNGDNGTNGNDRTIGTNGAIRLLPLSPLAGIGDVAFKWRS
jgi:hypothetical protein